MNHSLKFITEDILTLPTESPDLPQMGGYVIFVGIVRNINEGKSVTYLEYDAYAEMADQMISDILKDAQTKWDLVFSDCKHRLGKVNLQEIAVIVTTGSIHRDEAYSANRYIIDRVKHEVPIWKKEYYIDGSSEWSKGCIDESHKH